ncbi:MAG: hypothetical protein A2293_05470 [Elusimicrobia bacterium RIFOXYB2_FULL_49_7]|nr:MAG: hypothetical protein A2293_05470 [Elusimicrobia bacterium RIFOXYB2_FULL_49_7]
MEETGCEQGEAELALELAGQDLEKAIRTIESLLRHISALRGKLHFVDKNLYGLLLVIINTKTQEILRLRSVVSYNPALYENSPTMDWYALEKLIFSYRLDEGSLPDYTQDIEQKLYTRLTEQRENLAKAEVENFERLLAELFAPEKVMVTLHMEELNLAQFRRLPKGEAVSSVPSAEPEYEPGGVCLEVELLEDKGDGKEVMSLEEGEVILSKIVDTRDIAHYLGHLIGSHSDGVSAPLPAVVRKISVSDPDSEVQVSYAPGILGIAKVKNGMRVKILETKAMPWWKRIIPWS